jgi:CBS domain containing-hemolysin-like protein
MNAFYLLITALLILANAFFVASEFAIVKVRPNRLEQLVRGGDARAKLALSSGSRSHRSDSAGSASRRSRG